MPVKVKEMVIQASFSDESSSSDQMAGSVSPAVAKDTSFTKEEVINECMDKVIDYLNDKEER